MRVTITKIGDFLEQPEPVSKEKAKPQHPDYAVYIENQNFTWGVKTVDIDEMFDKMYM